LLKHIRPATEEEIKSVQDRADLARPFSVLASENKSGETDLLVVRQVFEVDPVFYAPATNDIQKARLMWGIEERLIGAGVDRYYFNVLEKDERWQKIAQEWGAKKQSLGPEIRFYKNLP
jgi:hypothetical protein